MAYTRVNWEDLPSTATPRNATNLNKMDAGIKENDDKLLGNKSQGKIVVEDVTCKNLLPTLILGDVTNFEPGQVPSVTASSTNRATSTQLFIPVPSNTYITVSINTGYQFALIKCDSNKQTINSTEYITSVTEATGANVKYVCIKIRKSDNSNFTGNDLNNVQCQIEVGSTATPYTPYKGFGYETGQNVNGSYMKFDDGTMIQYGTKTLSNLAITSATASGVYRSAWQSGIWYGQAFIEAPKISNIFIQQTETGLWIEPQQASVNEWNALGFYVCCDHSTTNSVVVGYFAIGRWK